MKNQRRIASHYLYTPQGFLKNGVLTIDPEGYITDIDTVASVDSLPGVEFYSGILIPGMVNAHCHLELSYTKGLIDRGGGMAGFAAGMRINRESVAPDDRLRSAEYQDAKMWSEGVSAVADICNGDSTFALKKRSRIRYHSFIEVFGLRAVSTSNAVGLTGEARAEGLSASLTPHSTYSLNEAVFRDSVSHEGLLSVHFMESREEYDLFHGKGALREWYDSLGLRDDFTGGLYASPTERIIRNISRDKRVMLIHNTVISEGEALALSRHFENNLTWVVCPRSNDYITGGHPPVEMLLGTGSRVAAGTDSLASNTSLSLIEEIKAMPELPLDKALDMITLSGAQALGIEKEFGSLETGKRPGVVLLEGVDTGSMILTPQAATRRIV